MKSLLENRTYELVKLYQAKKMDIQIEIRGK